MDTTKKQTTIVVELEHPIQMPDPAGGPLLEMGTVIIHRLKAKHLKHIPDSMLEGTKEERGKNTKPAELIPLLAAMGNLPLEVAGEIDVTDDIPKLVEAMATFLVGGSPKTEQSGSTSSGPSPTSSTSDPVT